MPEQDTSLPIKPLPEPSATVTISTDIFIHHDQYSEPSVISGIDSQLRKAAEEQENFESQKKTQ